MNYLKIYKNLIQKRIKQPSTQQYTEKHHIIPKSIDPSKTYKKSNLVILSARQHFIAHALLVKITQKSKDKSKYYKMIYAFNNMNMKSYANEYRYINSHLYQLLKQKVYDIKGKILIHNIKTDKHIFIYKDQEIPEGWVKGKSQKMRKRGKGGYTYGTKWCYNPITLQQKLLKQDEQLEQGWLYGMSPKVREKQKEKYSAPTKDKIWITNLELKQSKIWNKYQTIPEGWIKGRKIKF